MVRPRLRFLSVLLLSAAAAYCAWHFIPTTPVDLALVKVVARSTANPPFIISGTGARETPWTLRVIAPYRKADPTHAPVIVSLGDDPQGIFESSPPSPLDLAIVVKNMQRLGATKAGISAVLAWEKPDPIALTALDSALGKFPALATAAPLSRTANTTALPPSFRRASIPLGQIHGDTSVLPAVNRISLPDVILGGDSAISGFSVLEQETATGAPLIARWDDRAVFAFAVTAVLVQQGLTVDDLDIQLGNFIKFGKTGPIIPIDSFGRISTPPGKISEPKIVRADTLIDTQQPIPTTENSLVLLRDDQSSSETATLDFSKKIASLIADISSGASMSPEQKFNRLSQNWELGLLGGIALLLAFFAPKNRFARQIAFGIIGSIALVAHFIGTAAASVWLPTLPAIASVLTAFLISRFCFRENAKPVVIETPPPIAETSEIPTAVIVPESAIEEFPTPLPEIKIAKKRVAKIPTETTSPKPALTKKAAIKKSPPAKKVAAKKSPRAKKSPPTSES